MKITNEYYDIIAKEICNNNNYNYNSLKDICYNNNSAIYYKPMKKGKVYAHIMVKDTCKMVPVLEIFNTNPYTYKVYDEEWLKNA